MNKPTPSDALAAGERSSAATRPPSLALACFAQAIGASMLVLVGTISALLREAGTPTMSIIAWLVLGLIAGFIGSKIVNTSGQGLVFDIVLGIVGAVVGGALFSLIGAAPVTGFNLYSLIVAVVGAIVVLWIYHAVIGRRSA